MVHSRKFIPAPSAADLLYDGRNNFMNAEEQRLEEARQRTKHWKRWGPYLSERAWGTVREDYSPYGSGLGLLSARSRAVACLSLERRRNCRDLRSSSKDLFRHRTLERSRSDFERTSLWFDRQRRQSRRRRQGILFLPRFNSDSLVHEVFVQVSARLSFPTVSWLKRIGNEESLHRSLS